MITFATSALACAVWVVLLLARGGFWRAAVRDDTTDLTSAAASSATELMTSSCSDVLEWAPRTTWPGVVAIVPARNEADLIGASVSSLLRQAYPGSFTVIVVDDHSCDGTAEVAQNAAATLSKAATALPIQLTILQAPPLPAGWTGKLWALQQGVAWVERSPMAPREPEFLLFTDADIVHAPDMLDTLVARGERDRLALVSLMARLNCVSGAERFFIPAFIFFFQLLYPFAWVNDSRRRIAAAAGGCMLVRWSSLSAAGGIEAIRASIIDDCALARALKRQGSIWLGLSERVKSIRPYASIADIRSMIVRSAYAELRFSPWRLLATIASMTLIFIAPPILALFVAGVPQVIGALTYGLSALALQPTLRFYGRSFWWGFALPAIALVYLWFTLDSAYQHWRGRGGAWKGRAQAAATGRP